MASIYELKDSMCEIGRRIWEKGFVASNDGNFSIRIDEDEILTTPTGVSKGFMNPGMLVIVDSEGKKKYGDLKPSSEIKMHLEVYKKRPDINSVVHAHPPTATGFAVAGLATCSMRTAGNSNYPGCNPVNTLRNSINRGNPSGIIAIFGYSRCLFTCQSRSSNLRGKHIPGIL